MSAGNSKISLELRLLTMPLLQMIDALDAIEELDLHVLEAYKRSGSANEISAWRAKMEDRQAKRLRFLEFRLAMESSSWLH